MHIKTISRRHLLMGTTAVAALSLPLLGVRRALAENGLLAPTPADVEGPFYPVEIPEDSDNDLLHVIGRQPASCGQLAYVHGCVMDREGRQIDGARVEVWQCDFGGVYRHPNAPGEPDPDFQGFGAMVTDRQGNYHFRAMRPVAYGDRTPHIHYRVTAPGFDRLTTQLYVAEEAGRNASDALYQRHGHAEQQLLTSAFEPTIAGASGPVVARFDIVLG